MHGDLADRHPQLPGDDRDLERLGTDRAASHDRIAAAGLGDRVGHVVRGLLQPPALLLTRLQQALSQLALKLLGDVRKQSKTYAVLANDAGTRDATASCVR